VPAKLFLICWTLFSLFFALAGAILASNPALFVRLLRRIAIGDYYIKSAEWEKSTSGLEARFGGFVFFCFGLGGFYVLLKMTRVL
jgi:hypothetical protein